MSNSNVLIYDFKEKNFSEKFSESFKKHEVITEIAGLSEIFTDGSILVEEHNFGRILIFNKNGNLESEFINKAKNGKIYSIEWSRLLSNNDLIKSLYFLLNKKNCK